MCINTHVSSDVRSQKKKNEIVVSLELGVEHTLRKGLWTWCSLCEKKKRRTAEREVSVGRDSANGEVTASKKYIDTIHDRVDRCPRSSCMSGSTPWHYPSSRKSATMSDEGITVVETGRK
ncbi:unnamed protein product [Nesidiocoris tenuis]|uniref:Uncharacterized protein n=1 Tax=Nesidiocoris tenuis TaxID=355587 RepID=A0A6H5HDB8_9HEMI|nr:unnamed protein product [Nesidiocoris tenuis]